MSHLAYLIRQLCPDGVPYKTLGEVATITRGGSLQKKDFVQDGFPCIHYGQIYTRYGLFTDKTLTFIPEEIANRQRLAAHGDIVMAVTSENNEDICKCVAWLGKGNVAVSGHTAVIHHTLHPKFIAYYFNSTDFFNQKLKLIHGTKVMEVTPDRLNSIRIPVPPLPVQEEIVRILDAFTTLEAELEAELEARRRQYEYYRSILIENSKHQTVLLGDVAKFKYGFTASASDSGSARFIRITDIDEHGCLSTSSPKYININDNCKEYMLSSGDLVVARTGATFGKTLYISSDAPAVYASFLIKIILDRHQLNTRFYWHFAQSQLYWHQAEKLVSKGGQPQFNTNALKQIKVPLPSLEEQSRIVGILDRFDTLCNDLCKGLPAEIAARHRQYEYYRDRLLSFKEAKG